MPVVLDVEHVSVSFGPARVLDDVNFQVESGSSLAIIGPNGAGKTVLFKALIGALPYQGAVRWAPGTRLGYVPQKLDIERDLPVTGVDFLRAKAAVSHASPDEVARVLELVALRAEVAKQTIGTLSGGQFQRLLIAFALMGRPTVVLFDEPTAGVDESAEEGIYVLLQRLQREQNLTLFLISHELNLVYRYADRVLCLSRRLACFGPPVEILTTERLRELYGPHVRFHLHDHDDAHA
jgi:zinc transport system ATP-binding protein